MSTEETRYWNHIKLCEAVAAQAATIAPTEDEDYERLDWDATVPAPKPVASGRFRAKLRRREAKP